MCKVLSLLFIALMAIGVQAQSYEWKEVTASSPEPTDFVNVPVADALALTVFSDDATADVYKYYFYAYEDGKFYITLSADGSSSVPSWEEAQNTMASGASYASSMGKEMHFYYPASTVAPVTLSSIQITGTAAALWKGDAFSHNGITVTAYYSDETSQDVTALATYTGYDMSVAGSQTVTVTYETLSDTYPVTVQNHRQHGGRTLYHRRGYRFVRRR